MENIERKIDRIDARAGFPSRLEKRIDNILREKNRPGFKSHVSPRRITGTINNHKQNFNDKNIEQGRYHHPGYLGGLENKKVGEISGDRYKEKTIVDRAINPDPGAIDNEEMVKIDLV